MRECTRSREETTKRVTEVRLYRFQTQNHIPMYACTENWTRNNELSWWQKVSVTVGDKQTLCVAQSETQRTVSKDYNTGSQDFRQSSAIEQCWQSSTYTGEFASELHATYSGMPNA